MDEINNRDVNAATERIAAPLRASERLSAGFEDRLLSRLRAEVVDNAQRKERPRSWWVRPRTTTRAPLTSVALAAGLAAIVALSTLAVVGRTLPAPTVAQAAETVHVVRFVYVDTTASHVQIVGDFNSWGATDVQLSPSGAKGVWTASLTLPAGAHEYAFVIDRKRWVADPFALSSHDEFGTPTSRVALGHVDATLTQ
jgi:hypothetical protein